MKSGSIIKKLQLFMACAIGGSMLVSGCSMRDLQTNLVAGTLAYVKSEATTFWSQIFSVENFAGGN
ncbi:MAG TPA: hypothetical protein P5572_20755 [Phycisphaerae bacterium]|nr:hypothetical protein [Phycisphaerae bacterium]